MAETKPKATSNLLEVPSPGGAPRVTANGVDKNGTVAGISLSRVSMRQYSPQPDGGWGWMVCLTSMTTNGIVFGLINCFGILYVALRDKYAKDDPNISFKTAWVGSVNTGVTFFMCMISSVLSDRIGIRITGFCGGVLALIGILSSAFVEDLMLLYLTYGVFMGFGFALVYTNSLVIVGHYFRKYMGIVNGLVTFGSSVVTISLTFAMPAMLKYLSIRETFFVLSGLVSLLVICPLTWKPIFLTGPAATGASQAALSTMSMEVIQSQCADCCRFTKKFLNVRIWRNKGYVVWALSIGFSLFGYFVPFVHLPKYVNDKFPDEDGKFLVMCLAITSGLARIVMGKVADFKWVNRIRLQQLAFFLLGASTLCLPWSPTFAGLIALCLIMGICDGAFICLLGPIAFDIVGEKGASQALGFLFGIFSIPMTVGPPVAGMLYDHFGTYKIALHLAGIPPIIGAALMFFIPKTKPNVPAVLSIQEFAAVSCHDIYHSRLEVDITAPPPPPASSTAAAQSELVTIEDMSELYLLSNPDTGIDDQHIGDEDPEALQSAQNGQKINEGRKESVTFKDAVADENTEANSSVGKNEEGDGKEVHDEDYIEDDDEKLQFLPNNGAGDSNVVGEVDV
ncbi:monocarboxylate transporter 10 [Elysia marginata]|uniref:Monocarboxylate transporter 10 n=1 Tax=Elysia marginata TaxID=1093978 RepID=A0AAV4IZ60_9GAST|nr:monocarboxylate transporter 10 [Elysia marginata]